MTMERARRAVPKLLARPSSSLRYVVYCRFWAVGMGVHLTLPDALDDRWLVPNLFGWVGLALIALNGSIVGWALAVIAKAWPLLFLHDQLTQSVYLLLTALAASVCMTAGPRGERTLATTVRALTLGVYGIAALHKMNRDFFDTAVSCANGGMQILAENWSLPALAAEELAPVWPPLFLATELALVVLFAVRPAWAVVLALVMHLPLTLIFAPAFAFTMIPGWVAFFRAGELRWYGSVWRRRWKIAVPIAVALFATSVALYFRDHWMPYPFWFLKELVLWVALVVAVLALVGRPREVLGPRPFWRVGTLRCRRWLPIAAAIVWLANGLTPYLGLQFHHAGAMLSNLRIDPGCWNSYVFPEAMRLRDPYIHVEHAEAPAARGREVLEDLVTGTLWNVVTLREAAKRWCDDGAAPLRIRGRYDGEPFEVADLCATETWPFDRPLVPGFLAFQRNLSPECPQACVH